jgi:O-antigen/teichoic acid export membrane protein
VATDDPTPPTPPDPATPGTPRRSGSLLSGASVLVAGRYAVAALAWVGTIIIVRQLTVEEFGEYSVIFSLLGIVGFIADLRISRVVLADVLAAEHDDAVRVVGSYTGLRLVIGVVSYAVAILVVLIGAATGDYSREIVIGTAIGGLNLVILSVAYGLILLYEARLWLRDVALANVIGQAAAFALIAGVTVAGVGSLQWFVAATVVNAVFVLAWLILTLRRGTGLRIGFDTSQWWVWLKEAAPLALGAALDTVYFRIDVIMLSIMASSRAAGIYNIGYKFSDLLGAVPIALMTPALTLMVAAWPNDRPGFRRTLRHTYVLLLVGAVGAIAAFLVYAEPLIVNLYKPEYAIAAPAARLLVVGQGIHFLTLLAFTTLVAVKRNRLYPIAMLLGVVVNIGLNILLIPEYSYVGSGWATVITEVLVLAALGAGVARIPGLAPFPWMPTVKTLGAGVVTGLVGWAMYERVPWPLALVVLAVLYLAMIHVLAPNGPGGLRAFAGEPIDDLDPLVADEFDRRNLGTGEGE